MTAHNSWDACQLHKKQTPLLDYWPLLFWWNSLSFSLFDHWCWVLVSELNAQCQVVEQLALEYWLNRQIWNVKKQHYFFKFKQLVLVWMSSISVAVVVQYKIFTSLSLSLWYVYQYWNWKAAQSYWHGSTPADPDGKEYDMIQDVVKEKIGSWYILN